MIVVTPCCLFGLRGVFFVVIEAGLKSRNDNNPREMIDNSWEMNDNPAQMIDNA